MTGTIDRNFLEIKSINTLIESKSPKLSHSINQIKSNLVEQLYKPVLWTSSVEKMKKLGIEKLLEAGPGRVLAGLTRRIDKSLSGTAIIDTATLKSTIEEIS